MPGIGVHTGSNTQTHSGSGHTANDSKESGKTRSGRKAETSWVTDSGLSIPSPGKTAGKVDTEIHDRHLNDTTITTQSLRRNKPDCSGIKPDSESVFEPERQFQGTSNKTEPVASDNGCYSLAKAYQQHAKNHRLTNRILAGTVAGAMLSGGAVAMASGTRPTVDKSMFDHILLKTTPVDQMVIFSQHNAGALAGRGTLPLIANSQTMTIEDTLNITPVRGFGLDLHMMNGEMVINHGGLFDSTVSDDNIPRLQEVLETMNHWLDSPQNQDEVIFLNFDNLQDPAGVWELLEKVFGEHSIIGSLEYDDFYDRLGKAPTINEIKAEGYRVAVFEHNDYFAAGRGETGFSHHHPMDSIWEDRTLLEHVNDMKLEVGYFSSGDIAPHLTTDDIDKFVQGENGTYVSLDKISPNDPRFFKPEDRDSLTLRPDLKLMGLFYQNDEAFQTALMGFSTTSSSATSVLALASGAYQGALNEKKIRHQDKLLPAHLKTLELSGVLQRRKRSKKKHKKPLKDEITVEEVLKLYKSNQLKAMTKDTAITGISATVSLTGSTLALAMLFPPLFPAFAGTSATIAGAGVIATSLATYGNRRRLVKAIDKAFQQPQILQALKQRVAAMNQQIKQAVTSEDIDIFLANLVAERETAERLLTASTTMLSTSLVARASGMAKYGMPAIGYAAMGVGASITGVLVGLSAAMNYRERRSKLSALPQTAAEILRPDYSRKQKRKLCLFGDTAFQRYLKKQGDSVRHDLNLPEKASMKDISLNFSLPGNEIHLEKYLRLFAGQVWLKDLNKFARRQKPKITFSEIIKDQELLKPFLIKYIIKQVADFAYNDTWREGRSGTLKLALIGAFSGILFLPMLGVAAGTLGIGLGVSKGVAVHERKVFTRKLETLFERPPANDPEKTAIHNSLNEMISCWSKMLTSTNDNGDQYYSHSLTE